MTEVVFGASVKVTLEYTISALETTKSESIRTLSSADISAISNAFG